MYFMIRVFDTGELDTGYESLSKVAFHLISVLMSETYTEWGDF